MKKNEFKPDKPRSGALSKLVLTRSQRRSLLKWTLYALALVVLSLLQDVVLCRLQLLGATCELVPCGIFLICILEGVERGSIFALAASTVYLFTGTAAGYHSIVFITTLAVLVTAFRQSYLQRGFFAALLGVAVAMVAYEMAVFLIAVFLGLTRWPLFYRFLLTAAMSLPAVPLLYPIFLLIGGGNTWNE